MSSMYAKSTVAIVAQPVPVHRFIIVSHDVRARAQYAIDVLIYDSVALENWRTTSFMHVQRTRFANLLRIMYFCFGNLIAIIAI